MLTLYSFGKVGMRHFHLQQNHYWRPIINLDKVRSSRQTGRTSGRLETNSEAQLWSLVPAETREAYISGKKKDTAPVINLLNLGYSKLLGSGRIPAIPARRQDPVGFQARRAEDQGCWWRGRARGIVKSRAKYGWGDRFLVEH